MISPDLTTACIRSRHTVRVVGGSVAQNHDTGGVAILGAGMRTRGRPITLKQMMALEKGAIS